LTERVHGCLRRLGTEYVDVLHLHGVRAPDYDHCVAELVPALVALRDAGKIRFLGITEAFGPDPGHEMLVRAVQDDCWDVMMVGFNILNQSARERVFPATRAKNIGVLDMFAVRRALANPNALKELVADLARQGRLDGRDFDANDPLGFLLESGAASSVTDAAYRFCRYEPGIHVVLSGTGSVAHLEANAASLSAPPLPDEITERLRGLFAGIDSVSGN
jgi:aryl-alcohol dehydrogenase-like predicted oxidoreductase